MHQVDARGTIVTVASSKQGIDFISRWFGGPDVGINEDPVMGSTHSTLTTYGSETLNKNELEAIQESERRGRRSCEYIGDRVQLSGQAVLYFSGEIFVWQLRERFMVNPTHDSSRRRHCAWSTLSAFV